MASDSELPTRGGIPLTDERFPPGSVGAARDFLAAHTGLPRESVAHYAVVMGDEDELTSVVTCCDEVDETTAMLRAALAALGSGALATTGSRSVIVSREDLRAALKADLPEEARSRFLEALGLPAETARLTPEADDA
jgi:hypothetical protein